MSESIEKCECGMDAEDCSKWNQGIRGHGFVTEQDLQRTHELIVEAMKKLGSVAGAGYWPVAKVVAAEFSRIRSEARAGMREACKQIAIEQKTCEEHSSEPNAIKACAEISYDIEHLPDLAADEAIERIKREARLPLTADLAAMVNYRYLLRDVTERLLRYVETVYPRCPEDSERELEAAEERRSLITAARTILYETGIAALSGKETSQ